MADEGKKVCDNILSDLGLQPNSLPLLVGELVSEGQGGACASMNPVIQKLPETIPVVHVVSSEGCEAVSDRLHFSAAGYRELGKRYAFTMLELLKRVSNRVFIRREEMDSVNPVYLLSFIHLSSPLLFLYSVPYIYWGILRTIL